MPVVQNVVLDPSGAAVVGAAVNITLVTGASSSPGYLPTSDVIRTWSTITDNTGKWSVTLAANSTLTPANTYYQVTEAGYISNIVVPAAGGPYNLSQVLQAPPPSPASLAIASTTVTAKGDLIAGTGPGVVTRHAVGADGLALLADSTQPDGLRWGTAGTTGGDPGAAMLGLAVQTYPYQLTKDGIGLNGGTVIYKLVRNVVAQSISTLYAYAADPLGTANGVNGLALYTEAGVLIDRTGDMSSAFTSTRGVKSAAMGGSQSLAANTNYYLALIVHSSATTYFGGFTTGVPNGFMPVNGHYASLVNFGPITDFPSSFTPSAQSVAVATIWLAAS